MVNWISINKILLGLIFTSGIFLAFLVYLADRKNKVNRIFLGLVLSAVIWTSLDFATSFPSLFPYALLLARIEWAMISIFIIFAYLFSVYFPKESKRYPALDKIVVSVEIIFFALSLFTDTVIKSVVLDPSSAGGVRLILGQGGTIDLITMAPFTILIFVNIIKKYFTLSQLEKLRVQYFLIGLSIYTIANLILNVGLMFFMKEYPQSISYLGTSSVIFLFGFAAYAIIKKQLFGIKVILTQLFVVAIAILLSVNFFVSKSLFEYIWKGALFIAFAFFGWLLVKSVIREIKQKEQLGVLNTKLADLNQNLQQKVDEQTVEVRRAYEVEKKARVELEELDKAKDQFILTTQHHLRTPLTIIKGYVESLLNKSPKTTLAESKDALDRTSVATNRLASLVNELLDISQMEVGKSILRKEPINPKKIVEEILSELQPGIEKKSLKISVNVAKDLSANLDPLKFREALNNVIDNSVKYNNDGGSITVKAEKVFHPIEKDKQILRIIVEDTGIGIDAEEIPKLFAHYFERGGETQKVYATGRGIGLMVARNIINAHGGRIWVESEGRGKGAKFFIEIPA